MLIISFIMSVREEVNYWLSYLVHKIIFTQSKSVMCSQQIFSKLLGVSLAHTMFFVIIFASAWPTQITFILHQFGPCNLRSFYVSLATPIVSSH